MKCLHIYDFTLIVADWAPTPHEILLVSGALSQLGCSPTPRPPIVSLTPEYYAIWAGLLFFTSEEGAQAMALAERLCLDRMRLALTPVIGRAFDLRLWHRGTPDCRLRSGG